ncbi:MAG: spermidine/putrescine ABC transporter substrate-binding protein [Actinobacteria bacterium]|nr:spermidine/putrescine ABC transporter substrate-binding protein [Actinomycetota bacterium]
MTRPATPDPVLRELMARAGSAGLSRRTFLGLLGAAGSAAALAACGTGGSTSTSSSAATGTGGKAGTIRWANWTLYIDLAKDGTTSPTLQAFEKSSGLKVDYREDVEDNDTFYGKVKGQLANGQDIGYDLVTLTDWMAARWIRQGYTATLDRAAMPNTQNILANLANVDYDPGRTHSLTWQSGFGGIAWAKDQVPAGLGTVSDLWKPELKGRVEVLSEMRDTIGLIMFDQGVDPASASWGDTEFENALDVLKAQIANGQIRSVKGNSYKEDLVSGDAVAVIGWSGDIQQLNLENDNKFTFAIPEAGGTLWSDNVMVPSTSGQVTDVQKLIDYYYDPEVAATVAAYVNYITPVQGAQAAMEKVDPSLVDNQLIFPSESTLSKVAMFRTLTTDEEEKYNSQFLDAIGA